MTKQQAKEYCEAEFENIDAVMAELSMVVKQGKEEYTTADLAAMATFIHNFYNGIENILKRMLIAKKKELKATAAWHKDLLEKSIKVGIISEELADSLSNYLSFRHFFIHGYSFTLKWEAMKPLVENVNKTWEEFRSAVVKQLV